MNRLLRRRTQANGVPQSVASKPRNLTQRIIVTTASGVVLCLAVALFMGPILTSHDPNAQNLMQSGLRPGAGHWLGTDSLGRDIFARVVIGARAALFGPLVFCIASTLLAVIFGLLAGFHGGWIETVIMRIADMLFAIPGLLVIIVTVGLFGGGYWLAVLLLVVLTVPGTTRVIRSAVLGQRHLPYVEAAATLGVSSVRLMFVHVLPNILPTVVAGLLLDFVSGLIGLSTLSFLGLGSSLGSADWGRMLTENRAILDLNPWAALAPALLLIVTAFAFTVLGDWAYERLERRGNSRV